MPACYVSEDDCTSKLGKKMHFWRAERPDEWTMDEFICDADKLDTRVKKLEEALGNLLSRVENDKDCKNWFIDEQKMAKSVLMEEA